MKLRMMSNKYDLVIKITGGLKKLNWCFPELQGIWLCYFIADLFSSKCLTLKCTLTERFFLCAQRRGHTNVSVRAVSCGHGFRSNNLKIKRTDMI